MGYPSRVPTKQHDARPRLEGKVGLFGDIHAEDHKLEDALETLRKWGASTFLSVGDIVDGRGDVDRCIALLREADALAVRGNHERWFGRKLMRKLRHATRRAAPATTQYLDALPVTRSFSTPLGPLLLCHGLGERDTKGVGPEDGGYALEANEALAEVLAGPHSLIVNGHTHKPMCWCFGRVTIINAGTLRSDHQPGFAGLDLDAPALSFWAFDRFGGHALAATYPLSDQPSRRVPWSVSRSD